VYKLSKGGPPNQTNVVTTISITSTTPRDFARTGDAIEEVVIDAGPLFDDAVGVAPNDLVPFKRRAVPRQ
jgi:hypothetical protein